MVLWDFYDGVVSNGRRVQHTFRRPGQYAIRMALRGIGPNSHCVSQLITVLATAAP